jgi:hypothetical protein
VFVLLYARAVRLNLVVKKMGKRKIFWQWSRLRLEMTPLHFVSLREIVIINGVFEQLSVNCQHANTILAGREISKSSFVKIYVLLFSHMYNRKKIVIRMREFKEDERTFSSFRIINATNIAHKH